MKINPINVTPVILSGGSGSRLWPLSRKDFPKQFLALNNNLTLFQEAIHRLLLLKQLGFNLRNPIILGNESHRFIIKEQLLLFPEYEFDIILEPLPRNTAPAFTLAALYSREKSDDSTLIISPSDHKIIDIDSFLKNLTEAIYLSNENNMVVLGIPPKNPDTGFGYIQRGKKVNDSVAFEVKGFFEKPDELSAKKYLDSGDYYWNSGFFIMKANLWLQAIEKFDFEIYQATKLAFKNKFRVDSFVMIDKKFFEAIPSNSIDYAVIERCPYSEFSLRLIEMTAGWHDLGSWASFFKSSKKDKEGNIVIGDVIIKNCKSSLIYSTSRLVVALGTENIAVVETPDAVLVLNQNADQEVKPIVSELQRLKRDEGVIHNRVKRPWGWYEVIDQGENFKVKRINVNPGASLSLQLHKNRSEHWVVISGIAEVICGAKKIILKENESTFIPLRTPHRLKNPTDNLLEIIEVQSGIYVGEDDIIRIEDNYGRKED